MTESADNASNDGADPTHDAPLELSGKVQNGTFVWFVIGASLILLIIAYLYWSTIVYAVDVIARMAGALTVVYFVVWGVIYCLEQVFEKKNVAAAIFLVGVFAVLAWIGIRLLS